MIVEHLKHSGADMLRQLHTSISSERYPDGGISAIWVPRPNTVPESDLYAWSEAIGVRNADALDLNRGTEHILLKYLRTLRESTPLHDEDAQLLITFFYHRVIVVEQSPIDLKSIHDILASGSGAAIGALIGFSIASGPLLLIAVPTGMLVCGAAAGLAKGLEEGLRVRTNRWLVGAPLRKSKRAKPVKIGRPSQYRVTKRRG